jgi:hypothetical protein
MMHLSRRKSAVLAGALLVLSASVVAGVLASHSSANQPPSPGVSAGVSSLARLPAQASLPPAVVRFVEFAATQRGTDPEQAKARVRKLRSDLGTTGADLYAFRTRSGSTCFILVGQVGSCPASPADGSPGLQWTIGGGYGAVPSSLVGIASDEVTKVDLTVDGADVPVSLRNNVAFAEYPMRAANAEITIHRRDGSTSSETIRLEPPAVDKDLLLLRTAQANAHR